MEQDVILQKYNFDNLSDYLHKNWRRLLDCFIENQLMQLSSQKAENNISDSITFEVCICGDEFPFLEHTSQGNGEGKIDVLYHYHKKSFDNIIPASCALEIKTVKSDFLGKGEHFMYWTKTRGGFPEGISYEEKVKKTQKKLIATCPEGLFLFQKYSLFDGYPAMICFVNKNKLLEIFSDPNRIVVKSADTHIIIKIDDFEWHKIERSIPKIKGEFQQELAELIIEMKKQIDQEIRKIFDKNNTGNFICCDRDEIEPFKNAGHNPYRKRKPEYIQKGKELWDIHKPHPYPVVREIKDINPKTLCSWLGIPPNEIVA